MAVYLTTVQLKGTYFPKKVLSKKKEISVEHNIKTGIQ